VFHAQNKLRTERIAYTMSQEKVDRYKKSKANRKKELKKKKRRRVYAYICGTVVTLLVLAFLGWSVWRTFIKDDTTSDSSTYTLSEEELSSILAATTEETTVNALLAETDEDSDSTDTDTITLSDEEVSSILAETETSNDTATDSEETEAE
jgi:hypothetical protein